MINLWWWNLTETQQLIRLGIVQAFCDVFIFSCLVFITIYIYEIWRELKNKK